MIDEVKIESTLFASTPSGWANEGGEERDDAVLALGLVDALAFDGVEWWGRAAFRLRPAESTSQSSGLLRVSGIELSQLERGCVPAPLVQGFGVFLGQLDETGGVLMDPLQQFE